MTKGKSRIIQHPLSDYPLPSSTVIKAFGGLVIFRAIAGNITVSFYYIILYTYSINLFNNKSLF